MHAPTVSWWKSQSVGSGLHFEYRSFHHRYGYGPYDLDELHAEARRFAKELRGISRNGQGLTEYLEILSRHRSFPVDWYRANESGWPMRCAWAWTYSHKNYPTEVRSIGIWLSPNGKRDGHVLPVLPIPIGLTIDTIFWASAWWLAMFGLASFKKRRRSRKGRCAHCDYDLRGINAPNCPECGTPTPSPRRREEVLGGGVDNR